MTRMATWPGMLVLVAALGLGSMTLHACGSNNNHERNKKLCDVCNPDEIAQDCVDECHRFCAPAEDCDARCRVECDRCRGELACVECTGTCVEPRFRCGRPGEVTTCDNGRF